MGRFATALAVALVVLAVGWTGVRWYTAGPPGDYETRQGDIRLGDGDWGGAVERFDAALEKQPDHPGALMGRAIALMQAGETAAAERAFAALIEKLTAAPPADDPTARGVLAAAFANRGILFDRTGRPAKALADYRAALMLDAEAVEGPGLVDRVLYRTPKPATVAKRAEYLESQFALPPEKRVFTRPEIDAQQRMHKP